MLTMSSKPREKVKAVEYRFLFLSLLLLLRQLSLTYKERCKLVPTCRQRIQTCHQFQVHPITPFNLLHLPLSMTNTVVHDRWRNWHTEHHSLTHRYHPAAAGRLPPPHTSQHPARPWLPR